MKKIILGADHLMIEKNMPTLTPGGSKKCYLVTSYVLHHGEPKETNDNQVHLSEKEYNTLAAYNPIYIALQKDYHDKCTALQSMEKEMERWAEIILGSASKTHDDSDFHQLRKLAIEIDQLRNNKLIDIAEHAIQLAIDTLNDPYLGEDNGERQAGVINELERVSRVIKAKSER